MEVWEKWVCPEVVITSGCWYHEMGEEDCYLIVMHC